MAIMSGPKDHIFEGRLPDGIRSFPVRPALRHYDVGTVFDEWRVRIAEALPESPLDYRAVRQTYRVLRAIWRSAKWYALDFFASGEGWDWLYGLGLVAVAAIVMTVAMLWPFRH